MTPSNTAEQETILEQVNPADKEGGVPFYRDYLKFSPPLSEEAKAYINAAPMTKVATKALSCILVFFLFSSLLFSGCKTTPRKAAYQTIATVVTAVDVSKNVYYDYRLKNGTTEQTECQMKQAYLSYQSVMRQVEKAYRLSNGFEELPAPPELAVAAQQFISTISQITGATALPSLALPTK